MKIIKRNGSEVEFDRAKIKTAISKANASVEKEHQMDEWDIGTIAMQIEEHFENLNRGCTVEEVQDAVEKALMNSNKYWLARAYVRYRYDREKLRQKNTIDDSVLALIDGVNEELKQENANKNPTVNSTQRDYMAGEVSKDLTRRVLLPKDIVEAHDQGIIHFHDADYFAQHMHNCDLVNLEDMLQNGTVISGTLIEKPKKFYTACNVAFQIVAQVASNQYGGQTISLAHLAPFVNETRKKYKSMFEDLGDDVIEKLVREDVKNGVQTMQYQAVTLLSANGQSAFCTLYLDINEAEDEQTRKDLAMVIEEVLKQRTQGTKNEKGVWVTPAFPKLIYTLDENNIHPDSEFYYLTELAAKCTAKRMVPDYISAKVMRELKKGDTYTCMGCRSFLTPDRFTDMGIGNIAKAKNYIPGKHRYYGRFNQGVVTLNLPDIALSSGGNFDKFWEIMDERLNLCYRALMCRHERLKGTASDAAPILWQHGALARLEKGETIDDLLYHGYSTISLGYAGLTECVRYMTDVSHTDPEGKPFALQVMQRMNDACAEWKAKHDIDFSVYGTPIENTTEKFAKALQRRFGVVPGVSDKNYITNSYHVHVTEPIDAFTKLKFESEFQAMSPGGAISYVEVPDMTQNIDAVMTVIKFIYDNIMYAELNTKSDYCQVCGFDGEIQIVKDDNKLVWECPQCGNRDQSKLNVARRTCGYIGSQFWGQGRTEEIKERVLHL